MKNFLVMWVLSVEFFFFFWTCDFGLWEFFHVVLVMENVFWTCDLWHGMIS